jgi:HAD superfamily hydrolase (TIGR01509 family)
MADARAATAGLDTIFLDAGGVLVQPSWTRVAAALAVQDVVVEAAALARAEAQVKRDLDVAHVISATSDASRAHRYFEIVVARARGDDEHRETPPAITAALDDVRAYHARENLWEDVREEAIPALEKLRALGLRRVVVSNANGRLRAAFDRIGLTRHVDDIVDSTEVGYEKPDPGIFRTAMARAATEPARVLHVGDLYHVDVLGARGAGIRGILLDVADLYGDHDCPRVASLTALVDLIAAGDPRPFGPMPAVPP